MMRAVLYLGEKQRYLHFICKSASWRDFRSSGRPQRFACHEILAHRDKNSFVSQSVLDNDRQACHDSATQRQNGPDLSRFDPAAHREGTLHRTSNFIKCNKHLLKIWIGLTASLFNDQSSIRAIPHSIGQAGPVSGRAETNDESDHLPRQMLEIAVGASAFAWSFVCEDNLTPAQP
ncbi:hypothetical protein BDV18DRAFT_35564 [Aspergillus unguis]